MQSQLLTRYNKLNFGKYEGRSLEDVFHTDPGYLIWCLENISEFTLSDDMLNMFRIYKVNLDIKHLKLNVAKKNAYKAYLDKIRTNRNIQQKEYAR